ncbi:MAG: ATP-binding protein [Syntrophobacteraceae bacterium]
MDSYEKFMEKLDGLPFRAPRTESKVEIEILKRLMTPEEAEIACCLSALPEPVSTVAERAGMDAEDLRVVLEAIVTKGVIFKVYTEEPLYSLASMFPGIIEYQIGRLTPEDVKRWDRYMEEKLGKAVLSVEPQMTRIVPVAKSIPTEMNVFIYEEVEKLIDDATAITLVDCICRTKKKLIGEEGCTAPVKETCIYLDSWADYFAENKLGRRASKEEAKETLRRNRDAGLVHNAFNVQQGAVGICSCCACCCVLLRGISELKIPTAVARSNFIAEVSSEACTGCGVCVERCPVHALELKDDIACLIEERCIGCGACKVFCEFDAISLKRREEIVQPPVDLNEFLAKRLAGDSAT